jgi:mannose-6-phosphate isomerase-like protein (cupin superfamily)
MFAKFQTGRISSKHVAAPDGSEIRLFHQMKGGGLSQCTLPSGLTSSAVSHKSVDEIWFFTEGFGLVWRKQENIEETIKVEPGISLTIPKGTKFQFKNTENIPLKFIISTMPPWPGESEALPEEGPWPTSFPNNKEMQT